MVIEFAGEGQLNQNTIYGSIRVKFFYNFYKFVQAYGSRQLDKLPPAPGNFQGFLFQSHINQTVTIISHQDHSQTGLHPLRLISFF
jgi:hypothetical protein